MTTVKTAFLCCLHRNALLLQILFAQIIASCCISVGSLRCPLIREASLDECKCQFEAATTVILQHVAPPSHASFHALSATLTTYEWNVSPLLYEADEVTSCTTQCLRLHPADAFAGRVEYFINFCVAETAPVPWCRHKSNIYRNFGYFDAGRSV